MFALKSLKGAEKSLKGAEKNVEARIRGRFIVVMIVEDGSDYDTVVDRDCTYGEKGPVCIR